jgi:hypothetical protein
MKQHHAAPSLTPLEGAPLAAPASSHPERLRRLASKARQPLDLVGVLAGDPAVSATLDDTGKRNTAPDLIAHARLRAVQQRSVVHGEAPLRDRDRETGPVETAQEQHKKRATDAPHSGAGSQVATFLDHDGEAAELHDDHGSLDDGSRNIDESKRENATLGDNVEHANWTAMLEAAARLRPALINGTAAYRHLLTEGRPNGARRGNPAIR